MNNTSSISLIEQRIMMLMFENMFLITVPFSTLFTTFAMLLPYWWSSETLQVGLWRARSISSTWLLVEPQIETEDGQILLILQILSFISIILSDLCGILWLIILLRRNSFTTLLSLLIFTILTYLCLSLMIYLVWQTTKDYTNLIHISYSFYLVLIIILCHSLTLISITFNLLKYRTNHHAIQPLQSEEKTRIAFY